MSSPIIDTHTHLYAPEFDGEHDLVVNRAIEAGVAHMIFPNIDLASVEPMQSLAARFPGRISMGMGLHPTEVKESWRDDLDRIMAELDSAPQNYVAIGEVGVDLYWDSSLEREQMLVFDEQASVAERLGLPLIIHCRNALPQVLEVLQSHKGARAVMHSFGGSAADVDQIRRVGDYYFGINGIVTFKNCSVRLALPEITDSRVLLETDAPYLAPVPFRGKRNESAYIVHTAAAVASALDMDADSLCQRSTANAISLFSLKDIPL